MSQAFASSAAPNMSSLKTVELAVHNDFDAVQLFINPLLINNAEHRAEIVSALNATELIVVLHLSGLDPETFQLDLKERVAVESMISSLKNKVVPLVHYIEGMGISDIPVVNDQRVGLENSKTGIFDMEHIQRVQDLCNEVKIPFVLDFERILYTHSESEKVSIIGFVKRVVDSLDPDIDMLHLRDKTSWLLPSRKSACAYPEGINKNFTEEISRFHKSGGLVIWEFENLEQTLKSSKSLAHE